MRGKLSPSARRFALVMARMATTKTRRLALTCIFIYLAIGGAQIRYHNSLEKAEKMPTGVDLDRPPPHISRAVVHVGIHKTGSTSIQQQSSAKIKLLKMDGYEMPWVAKSEMKYMDNRKMNRKEKGRLLENQVNFATCFLSPLNAARKLFPCDPDLLLHGLDIARRNRNLFISAETFSSVAADGVKMLASYLSRWDEVTIVIYYRRFHSYIASSYNEMNKKRKLAETDKWEHSIIDFIHQDVLIDDPNGYQMQYTPAVVQRLKEQFNNVLVMNFHDGTVRGVDESFFCNAMPNATHTCNSIRASKRSASKNGRVDLDYGDLTYAARKAGLVKIKSDEEMWWTAKVAQEHHAKNLSDFQFQRVCLPPDSLEKMWKISLRSEIMFFPEQVNSTVNDLRKDFEEAARTTLCRVDVEKTLDNEEWRSFFKSLTPYYDYDDDKK